MNIPAAFGFDQTPPNWSLFWTGFGAIGGTVGSLVTAVAIFLALWQTKYPYKKKLILEFSDCTRIAMYTTTDFPPLVSLNISNLGNRDIYIQEWGYVLHKKNRVQLFSQLPSDKFPAPIRKALFQELPLQLSVEKAITLYFEQRLFLNSIADSVRKKSLKEQQKIKIYVRDSAGKLYYVKTQKTAKQILAMYQK